MVLLKRYLQHEAIFTSICAGKKNLAMDTLKRHNHYICVVSGSPIWLPRRFVLVCAIDWSFRFRDRQKSESTLGALFVLMKKECGFKVAEWKCEILWNFGRSRWILWNFDEFCSMMLVLPSMQRRKRAILAERWWHSAINYIRQHSF